MDTLSNKKSSLKTMYRFFIRGPAQYSVGAPIRQALLEGGKVYLYVW